VLSDLQAKFGTTAEEAKCSTAAFPKLFIFSEVGRQVSLVTVSSPSLRTVAPPPCLPLDIKDSLKGFFDGELMEGFLMGLVDWRAAEKLDETWDSASLSTETLRKLKREHGTVQI
jgi:hypothetical protein